MKKLWKWTIRISFGFIALIFLLLATGAIYQYASTKIDEKKYPPPGELVDIGGYRLHMHCTGDEGPTVIIDTGLGTDSTQWSLVQPEIAKFARVCIYDRAGYVWSDNSPYPRTSEQIVEELHSLLMNANIKSPYILVGHSFGGANVQLYAKKYPSEVIGLVLVDSVNEKQFDELPPEPAATLIEKFLSSPGFVLFKDRFGITRLLLHSPSSKKILKKFSKEDQEIILAHASSTKQTKTSLQEASLLEEDIKQWKNAHLSFGNLPLTVIAAGKDPSIDGMSEEWIQKYSQVWRLLQEDLATRSSKGKLVIAENSDHMIPLHQPEIIVKAVKGITQEIEK